VPLVSSDNMAARSWIQKLDRVRRELFIDWSASSEPAITGRGFGEDQGDPRRSRGTRIHVCAGPSRNRESMCLSAPMSDRGCWADEFGDRSWSYCR